MKMQTKLTQMLLLLELLLLLLFLALVPFLRQFNERQRQNQSPGTFTQRASTWQSWVFDVHSLMSKSQLKSVKPSWHVQVYDAAPLSSQVPKAYGFEAQSSTSLQPAPWA